ACGCSFTANGIRAIRSRQGSAHESEPVAVWRWSTKNWGYGEANNGPTPISDPCTTTCVASAAFFRIFTPAPPLPGYALRSILAPDLGCEARLPVHGTDPLFAWLRLEDHPQLATLAELLRCLPDGPLLDSLRRARGRGRDDYPVDRLWGVLLFTIALRHTPFESCLAERHRNASWCR